MTVLLVTSDDLVRSIILILIHHLLLNLSHFFDNALTDVSSSCLLQLRFSPLVQGVGSFMTSHLSEGIADSSRLRDNSWCLNLLASIWVVVCSRRLWNRWRDSWRYLNSLASVWVNCDDGWWCLNNLASVWVNCDDGWWCLNSLASIWVNKDYRCFTSRACVWDGCFTSRARI